MKTWNKALAQTWLDSDVRVLAVDGWVRSMLATHRKLDDQGKPNVAVWSVSALVRNVRDFGNAEQWLWCVAAIAITQELIFCAEGAGIGPVGIATHSDVRAQVEALRTIRNVVFHPAFQLPDGKRPPPMDALIRLLKADDDIDVLTLAERLPSSWASFAEKPVATYALRKLGSVGEIFIARKRLLLQS